MRYFNTTGPCDPVRHYMLPPLARLPDLWSRIERQQYFVLHAARQTGKTTAMRAFAQDLRDRGRVALHVSLEVAQGFDGVEESEPLWIDAIRLAAAIQLPEAQRPPAPPAAPIGNRLRSLLGAWSAALDPAPIVLLLDEADVVRGPALVSLLRQLRSGFPDRPRHFPAAVALIGMRDLRDYLTHAKDGQPVNPGSPFNIKGTSLTLRGFEPAEVAALFAQHTAETGQHFTAQAVDRACWWTAGQPFLVNALADLCCRELVPDRSQAIEAEHIDVAKERLIASRTTHLDSLSERLAEERVARVLQPILLGDIPLSIPYEHDDFEYTVDLGLVSVGSQGAEPANPIYREVLVRQLGQRLQMATPAPWWPWQTSDGRLDFPALIAAFLGWWRENEGAVLAHGNRQYPEALAHLAFLAFLQRVVNGGGQVTREFAAGRNAVDVVVSYAGERFVVELKRVFAGGKPAPAVREQGVAQLCRYLDTLGEREGWLLVFDQRSDRSWPERLWSEEVELDGRRLHLRGA